jgi:hypothetical protein
MKKTILLVLLFTAFVSDGLLAMDTLQVTDQAMAKDSLSPGYRNTAKVSLVAAYFRKLTLYYERELNDRWSVQMGAGYKFMGKFPKFTGLGDFSLISESRGLKGFSLTPEVRYKFWNNDCAQQSGLYLGGYGNVTRLYGDLTFMYWDGEHYIDVGGAGDFWEYGIGLQLGYQLTLGKHWAIDLMFMGPRLSRDVLKFQLDSQYVEEVIPLIEEELNKRLEWMGQEPVSIPTDADVRVAFNFRGFRYTVCVGYRF